MLMEGSRWSSTLCWSSSSRKFNVATFMQKQNDKIYVHESMLECAKIYKQIYILNLKLLSNNLDSEIDFFFLMTIHENVLECVKIY